MGKGMRLSLGVVVGFLAFIGIAASATHYLYEPYNPGFLTYPTIVALHVILGGVYLLFAPFQFVKRIRSRHLGYHRRVGRLLVSIGLVVGASAVFMGLVIPFSGWMERGYIGVFGAFSLHREWMIRAFAIGLAVATQRLIFITALFIVAYSTQVQLQMLSAAAFLVAFVVHASVAEAWIRLIRRRGVPGPSSSKVLYETAPDKPVMPNAEQER
jgi:hypothetical protein